MSKAQENAAFPGYTMNMDTKMVSFHEGMTLRDYFAAKVLPEFVGFGSPEHGAKCAYEWADAMMEARKK